MITITSRLRHLVFVSALLLGLTSESALAQPSNDKLKGISKATVMVSFNATGATPVGISDDRLRTILELRLRSSGMRVLTEQEDANDTALNPYVFLRVDTLETRNQAGTQTGYAYKVDLSARVIAFVAFNKSMAPAELWANNLMGIASVNQSSSHIERIVNELADAFLNAWLAANPKR